MQVYTSSGQTLIEGSVHGLRSTGGSFSDYAAAIVSNVASKASGAETTYTLAHGGSICSRCRRGPAQAAAGRIRDRTGNRMLTINP
jgi:hypothetical protein